MGPACHLVYGDEGREGVAVVALHALDEHGVALAEPFHLVQRQLHAPDGLLVEQVVLREDELQSPAFRAVLQGRAELLALGRHHAVHEHDLTVPQPRYLVGVEPYALNLVGNIDVLLPYCHQLVGDFVD